MNDFFTQSAAWHEKIGQIYALLERVKISEEQSADVLHLRKTSRILSIGSTTAIEGNRLSLSQVRDVINGKPVLGPPKDIKEVQNAYTAYELIPQLDAYSVDDFLAAHRHITSELINEAGRFRTASVFVVNGKGDILHSGADFNDVPTLISELFAWGKESDAHPLIKSSAMHFMIEHIHPFRDGNGRIGRLWQTLVLTKWNALFEWMPVETIIYNNQAKYYEALQRSHNNAGKVDCAPFIDFMLDVLENTMYKYIDTATTTVAIENTELSANDIVKLGVKLGVKLSVNQIEVLKLILSNNYITIKEMAEKIKISETAIQNNLAKLKTAGIIVRIGSDKSGYWNVIE
ncbi:MAG: Fic family protein [Bacteroidales bacterium]|nr:Fic family protein [Bacteroidales bacterium]